MELNKNARWLAAAIVILGWFALIAQFYLILLNRTAPVAETIVRYFSFFTILTNLLVALCFSFLLLNPKSTAGTFFSRNSTLAAVTVYILVVGLVYNLILRFLWQPRGLQLVVDELLHTVIPLLCIIFWWNNQRAKKLQWKNIFVFLIYPLLYILFVLVRGISSGFYPYPFIDVNAIGLNKVLINSGLLALCFVVVSAVFIAVDRKIYSKQTNPSD